MEERPSDALSRCPCSHVSPLAAQAVHAGTPGGEGMGANMLSGPGRQMGLLGAQILPRQLAVHRWWGCWHRERPGAVPSTPHSCLQKLFSGGGRSSPSMARRWTMCFWMTSRQRVCSEGTGREQKETAELAESPARLRAEGCGGDGL